MRRLVVVGLIVCGFALVTAGALSAAAAENSLALVEEVSPWTSETIYILTDATTAQVAGAEVGRIREKDGSPAWSVTVEQLDVCEAEPYRATDIRGEPVCLRIDRFPSATAAAGNLDLGSDPILALSVSSHHPRWMAFVVAVVSLAGGVGLTVVAASVIPAMRKNEQLKEAADSAEAAGIVDAGAWVKNLPSSVGHEARLRALADAEARLPELLRTERARLANRIAALDKHTTFVSADNPDVQLARLEAKSTVLSMNEIYDSAGQPRASAAERWRGVVDQLALTADKIGDLAELVEGLPAQDKHAARAALDTYMRNFGRLAFESPDDPLDNLKYMQEELSQLFVKYAQIPPVFVPTAAVAPSAPPLSRPEAVGGAMRHVGSRGLARLGALAILLVLAGGIVFQVAMGDSFGSGPNYLVLVVTALVAGLTAPLLLDLVSFADIAR